MYESGWHPPDNPGKGPGGQRPSDSPTKYKPGDRDVEPRPERPNRFHDTVELDPARVGRDAGRVAEEVVTHLVGLLGARVTVTLEIAAEVSGGAPEIVVRNVMENSRTLKFTNHGFEKE